jgi:hypothetical protein
MSIRNLPLNKAAFSVIAFLLLVACVSPSRTLAASESTDLPSWNDGTSKQSIIDFVKTVTDEKSADYVKPSERIAVFDNDGTLWCEKPIYVQVVFAVDRALQLVQAHPDLKNNPAIDTVVKGDIAGMESLSPHGQVEVIGATATGMNSNQFTEIVQKWLATAKQPRFKHAYTECVYQPMLEALAYLRGHGFKTYIVSGGGVDFMRPWTESVYGIPPEQVIGSSCKLEYEFKNNQAAIERMPAVEFIDDGAGKPVGIEKFIGRRPIIAFGNSDGDFQMLQWTTTGAGKRLGLIVHHTDAVREYEYDRKSPIGHLEKALDAADANHWIVIDMKNDWKKVFPF